MKTVTENIADQTAFHFVTDYQFVAKYIDDLDRIEKIVNSFFNFSDITQHLTP